MDLINNQSRGLLLGYLKAAGFSVGEAESRVEGLENDEELQYLIKYIEEHNGASVDELRFIHTGIVRKHEARKICTTKQKNMLYDNEQDEKALLIRSVDIDWTNEKLEYYLKGISSVCSISRLEFHKPITFFVGENGSGKSTLLEAFAVAAGYNPEGGTRNYNFSTRATHSKLCDAISLSRGVRRPAWGMFLRAESFYNMATEAEKIDEGSGKMFKRYGGQSFHEQSHGESFYTMLETDIKDNGLYFLDEPEAALSPRRQLNLLGLIHKYAGRGAQFIIATHSPILLACPNASIYEFSNDGINEISYEETDIYKIVSGFINDRDEMLKRVIIDEREF